MSTKSIKSFALLGLMAVSIFTFAKSITAEITVKGNCDQCKEKIEKALDIPGVSYAEWSIESKILTIRYNDKKITETEIHTIISNLGYATNKMKANLEAQKKLDKCCQPKGNDPCCTDEDGCKKKS